MLSIHLAPKLSNLALHGPAQHHLQADANTALRVSYLLDVAGSASRSVCCEAGCQGPVRSGAYLQSFQMLELQQPVFCIVKDLMACKGVIPEDTYHE